MAVNQVELDRRHELAEFLRSRRARLAPERVGLSRGIRRRTPGLRRQEVAMLAGVSPEWYTWLEQGRDIHVSVQLLESLARVLQLDANEREHLFVLALQQRPPVETYAPSTVSPIVQQFLDHLRTSPASAVDPRLNVVAWNEAHHLLFGDYYSTATGDRNRNLIWRLFTSPTVPLESEGWRKLVSIYLAQFRASYGRFIKDSWWAEQIAELSRISPEFRELWPRQEVVNVSEGQKVLHHPLVGELTFDFLWLHAVDSSDLRLLIHTPRSGSGTAEKVEQLLALRSEQNAQPTLSCEPV